MTDADMDDLTADLPPDYDPDEELPDWLPVAEPPF
jgi:hypothetical protein